MKINKFIFLGILILFLFLIMTFAKNMENEYKIISEETKYYRTTTFISPSTQLYSLDLENYISYSEEITREEYEDGNEHDLITTHTSHTVETTYKSMTTTISENGTNYRYKVYLNWKNMPKIRSYDVMAIGHYASVTNSSGIKFSQKYCTSSTSCTTSSNVYSQTRSSTGSGVVFKLPDNSSITTLSQTLYFDVEKSTNATVISQKAVGDYSHAVKKIVGTTASTFEINLTGIYFDSTSSSYFDEINPAIATWSGTW